MANNFSKFKQHLESGGLFYALRRGIKYFIYLVRVYGSKPDYVDNRANFISHGKTSIMCTESGIRIYWGNIELTSGIGLHSLVNTLGLWTDSSQASWHIVEKKIDCFTLRVVFRQLPLIQIWKFKLINQGQINLQIDMEVEENLNINEFRLMGLISNYYKSWISDYQQNDFSRPDNKLSDVYLGDQPAHLVGVRFTLRAGLPVAFGFSCNDKYWVPIVQNPPVSANARLIGIRKILPQAETYHPEKKYRIISIGLDLFEVESKLDLQVEGLRQDNLGVLSGNKLTPKRKIKILLVNLPWQKNSKLGVRAGSRWPHIKNEVEDRYLPFPFFLAYAASLLQSSNIEASMIDAIAQGVPEEKFLEMVLAMEFDYLVTETSIPSFYDDLRLLNKIAESGIKIILCGPNYAIYQPEFLQEHTFIRFVLYGEYEFTLLDLIESLRDGKSLSGVKGLIYRDVGAIRVNPKREPFKLDLLPWPLRDGLPMDKYLDAPGEMPLPSVQVMASRGCPFKCQFCLWPQVIYQGHHYRVRNVKDVVDEMQYLVEEKGFRSVYFDDDTFNIGKERMLEFCWEIKKRKLDKVKWAIMARADLMDEEILRSMKDAGLWAVKYGVESSVQSLVDNINKNMDLNKTTRMIELTKKIGIKVHLTFTFGLPGETVDTIQQTIDYVKRLDPYSAQFSITTPFPGTEYYKVMESKGWIVSKELPDYDGHLKSVIKLENLSSAQLEMGKEMAACAWNDHLRKRALWQDNIVKFYSRVKKEGISSALSKSLIYLKSHILAHDLIGADYEKPKSYDDVVNGVKLGQADIFLIECPPWDIAMPPLGIAYLASYLKKHRYKVRVFDLNIALYNLASSNTKRLWEQKNYGEWIKEGASPESASSQLKDVVEVVLNKLLAKVHIDCIGLSVNFASIPMVLIILKIIKSIKPKVKIILGGWGCINAHMRSFFPAGLVDIFVIGEGEATLLEIMKMLKGRKKESEVSGAIFNHQSVIQYEPRMPIMDLNLIPWPDFREFNLKHYHSRTIPLFTSRGCISKCNFCNDWAISKPYRYRDARLVFEEMKYHVKINRTTTFSLKDLLCNGNMKNLNLLADLIINSGLKIGWDSQAITHKEMTDEILCKLKRAGCETLVYGIESFSNNVLKRMGKLFTSQIAEEVLRNTYKAQIRSCVNLIVGFPGETEIDFQETLQALERNIQYISQIGAISVCLVNHNSDLENNHQHYGLILSGDTKIRAKEWTICTDLNTYQLRQARARQILALISKAGLKYETLTI